VKKKQRVERGGREYPRRVLRERRKEKWPAARKAAVEKEKEEMEMRFLGFFDFYTLFGSCARRCTTLSCTCAPVTILI
jgi:hypothetical protein